MWVLKAGKNEVSELRIVKYLNAQFSTGADCFSKLQMQGVDVEVEDPPFQSEEEDCQ